MKLYKDEGINMYGGCLPHPRPDASVLCLLSCARQTSSSCARLHWGWLPNLAVADPYHILPIIIICSMFLVQFITPSPGMDPSQRRMMAFLMPVGLRIFDVELCLWPRALLGHRQPA